MELQPDANGNYRGRQPWRDDRKFDPCPPVRWLSPLVLARSAIRAALSETFGDYADRREMYAATTRAPAPFDHRAGALPEHGDFWFDFVADIGDGFDATYTIAEQLACDQLVADREPGLGSYDPKEFPHDVLRQGTFLVMGGDEVYPVPLSRPDRNSYLERTFGPYELALQYMYDDMDELREAAWVYAIPGNHDWYDGLAAFTKQFCTGQWLGAWRTRQDRSYFALKLPHDWWLWGIDIGFGGAMDEPQVDYFRHIGERVIGTGSQVILCPAKPSWIDCTDEGDDDANTLLRWFVSATLPAHEDRVRLMLSGDSHFYARHADVRETDENVAHNQVKIVCGGGGASLSGTQSLEEYATLRDARDGPIRRYHLVKAWPSRGRARGTVAASAFLRVPTNWDLALVIAAVYFVFVYLLGFAGRRHGGDLDLSGVVERIGGGTWVGGIRTLARDAAHFPVFWFAAIVVGGLLSLLATRPGKSFVTGIVGGVAHTTLHIGAIIVIAATAAQLAQAWADGTASLVVYYLVVLTLSLVVGIEAFAAYLFVAQLFGRSIPVLAAGLRSKDWKCFLRLHVEEDTLTVYALGVRSVPTRRLTWRSVEQGRWDPMVAEANVDCELVDKVVIRSEDHPH